MAMEVKLLQPVKVVCTDDLGETLVDIMQTAGYSRPLMVTDSFVGSMPLVVAARTKLEQVGVDVAVFDQVKPDPLCETVESGVEAFEAHKADSIIAIGGGSSMDVARGINIVRVNGGSIIEYTDPADRTMQRYDRSSDHRRHRQRNVQRAGGHRRIHRS